MIKKKNVVYRMLLLFSCMLLVATINNCTSDSKDDELVIETFLEKNDGTKWKVTEEDEIIYLRINENMSKPIELWISEIIMAKGMADDDCYYYSDDLMGEEEMEILENSANKLTFTYLGNETWEFTVEGSQLKMLFSNTGGQQELVYFDKTNDDVDSFEICSEEFKFRFLK